METYVVAGPDQKYSFDRLSLYCLVGMSGCLTGKNVAGMRNHNRQHRMCQRGIAGSELLRALVIDDRACLAQHILKLSAQSVLVGFVPAACIHGAPGTLQ